MRRIVLLCIALIAAPALLIGQAAEPTDSGATLHINSSAVLVDVIVTDAHGNPVTGLKQDAFSVTEQGKPQAIGFFEEHHANAPAQQAEIPKLPQDVFTNFSPYPRPPAVTVLLLDSLNTRMENQSFVHAQALKFLKTAKPGSRMAIFTMGLGLHFVQGFTDDPTVLTSALSNKKNNWVETSVMLKGQDESNAQQNVISMMSAQAPGGGSVASPGSIAALQQFMLENDGRRTVDRVLLTFENFQRLATFLNSFPGRKNVIWFSESFPLIVADTFDEQVDLQAARTLDILAAARVALYPVDAGGAAPLELYSAGAQVPATVHDPAAMLNAQNASRNSDDYERNANQITMKRMAEQTGGKPFTNGNGLAKIIRQVAESSADFYTLSYTPTNGKMDGTYRKIDVNVAGGNYKLSYRRGYIALDEGLPGSGELLRERALHRLEQSGPVDPLLPFMDLGMPQSQQILIKAKIVPVPLGATQPGDPKSPATRYSVDCALATSDLRLPVGTDGLHAGNLNLSLIVYDRYGNVISRKDQIVQLHVQPDAWKAYEATGLQLHAEIAAPKGNYWLRTGVFDQQSRRVGTMEVPLAAVPAVQAAAQSQAAR
jgi:VWFA-related protein